MEYGNVIYDLHFRVSWVFPSIIMAILPDGSYHPTNFPFKKYNPMNALPPKMYIHNIEIAT